MVILRPKTDNLHLSKGEEMSLVNPKGCPILSIAKAILNAQLPEHGLGYTSGGMEQELCSQMDCEMWDETCMSCGLKTKAPINKLF